MGNELHTENNDFKLNLQGDTPSKKRKKWPIVLIISILVAVIGLTLFWILWDADSEEETLTIIDIERQNASNISFDSSLFGNAYGSKVKIDLNINKMALSLLEDNLGELDSILSDLSIKAAFEHNDNMFRFEGDIGSSDETLPNFEVILDEENKKLYFVSDELTDSYIVFDLMELEGMNALTDSLDFSNATSINETVLTQYLEKFWQLLIIQEQKVETITVNDISQQCNVYNSKINADDFMDLLEEIINDAEEQFPSLKDAFNSLRNELDKMALEDDILWTVYVNDSGKIMGRKICVGTEEILSYMYTSDKEQFGFVCVFTDLKISGSGKLKGNKMSGSFDLSIDGTKYLEISPEEYDLEDHIKGMPNGKIKIKLTKKALKDLLDIELDLPLSMTVEFESSESSKDICIDLMEIVELNIQVDLYEPGVIEIPTGVEIDGTDPDALNRWLESADYADLLGNLENVG